MTALEFLKRAADGKHRIVSSGDLHVMQISEAQANKLFFVDDQTGLGWALVPWELTIVNARWLRVTGKVLRLTNVSLI